MRHRETRTGAIDQPVTLYRQRNGGEITVDATGVEGSTRFKSIDDVAIPGFHTLQKCGEFLPLNPLVIDTTVDSLLAGAVDTTNHVGGTTRQFGKSVLVSPLPTVPPSRPELMDAAVLAAAADAVSDAWDLGTFLAELRSSVDFLAGTYRKLNIRSARLALKAVRRNPANAYEEFRRLWLGARYGVRPLLYDVRDGSRAIQKLLEGSSTFVVGRGYQQEVFNSATDTGWTAYNTFYEQRITTLVEGTRTYRGKAYCSYGAFGNSNVLMVDPLVTAWELTTFSFVYDWFIDIGAWVSTIRPQILGEFLGVCASEKLDVRLTSTLEWRGIPPKQTGFWQGGTQQRHIQRYTRGATTVPFPPLLPQLTIPKLIDLVTLAMKGRTNVFRILNRR